jgi:nucleotide sugar dehydrogenase
MQKETIVIVGYGWVGQANALALTQLGYEVFFYDVATPTLKYEDTYKDVYEKVTRISQVTDRDSESTWYIVCVGDKVDLQTGHQNIDYIKSALTSLHKVQGGVILRSTVLPSSLAPLSFDFYVPEFLHEKKAVEECLSPQYFIVGKKSSRSEPSFFTTFKLRAVKAFYGTPEQASYIKYLSNLWNSVRIAFVNEFGNTIGIPKDDSSLQSIEQVINFFFERKDYLQYGKSFGGHCLPKDTRAFYEHFKRQGKNVSLLEGAFASNKAHQENEKRYPILPEWYSGWVRPEMSGQVALKVLGQAIRRNLKKIVGL